MWPWCRCEWSAHRVRYGASSSRWWLLGYDEGAFGSEARGFVHGGRGGALAMLRYALLIIALSSPALAVEDCPLYCGTLFGPGIGVTCQATISNLGTCRKYCYYSNGFWIDAVSGRFIHLPSGSSLDQRPYLVEVHPYGYASLFGDEIDCWHESPTKGRGLPGANVAHWCETMARAEYRECYAFGGGVGLGGD